MDHYLSKAVLRTHLIPHICKRNVLDTMLILFSALFSDVLFRYGIEIPKSRSQ